MTLVLLALLMALRTWARSRVALQLEILALRHQLQVLQRRRPRRLRLAKADRLLWAWLSRTWAGWRTALVIVKPETVIAWHRRGFRFWWAWKSRRRLGRPTVPADVRSLIRTMALANPLWGARIHGELLKLGIDVSQATVAKYMSRRRQPPSQTWRSFLRNHVCGRRVLTTYIRYDHRSRTHLGLEKDTPDHRPVSGTSTGPIVAISEVGGLHHRYERRAA